MGIWIMRNAAKTTVRSHLPVISKMLTRINKSGTPEESMDQTEAENEFHAVARSAEARKKEVDEISDELKNLRRSLNARLQCLESDLASIHDLNLEEVETKMNNKFAALTH